MATIHTYPMNNSTILRLNSEKELINISPDYQRQGGVWDLAKKQLLIDSILNDYDIPKLYFHKLNPQQKRDSEQDFDFAIIDGRQRIEAIWEFIDGELTLDSDFEYLIDLNIKAGGLTYQDLAITYPKLKIRFDSYILPVILVETEDIDLIDDMFSRLNEAVPLNAAEKRNAFGGPMAKAIRDIATNVFFTDRVKFGNGRYQHREIAARLLFLELSLDAGSKTFDTKKPYLDKMVQDYKQSNADTSKLEKDTSNIISKMNAVFMSKDTLLRSQGVISVYYMLFRKAIEANNLAKITRSRLLSFYEALRTNREIAERDITEATFDYLEFDRLSQQGTNDTSSIKERTRILSEYLSIQ